jgi:hypothetical protein
MRTFCDFYGGKWALARRYGAPQRQHVIEPFAGFAGYSTYWEPEQVTLIEKDPCLTAIWKYLRRVSAREIMQLPVAIDAVDELPANVCEEARHLIGFWFNRGLSEPAKRRSNWARHDKHLSYWNQKIRARIASQVDKIRHWQIIEGDYTAAPDLDAHWFIDSPYRNSGKHYRVNGIDYGKLAKWCKQRHGYVQVCESTEANWLQFEPFTLVNTGACGRRKRGFHVEAIHEFENAPTMVHHAIRQGTTLPPHARQKA